jgi:hypothetical protein
LDSLRQDRRSLALHGTIDFDIISWALQMNSVQRSAISFRRSCGSLVLLLAVGVALLLPACRTQAQGVEPNATPSEDLQEADSARKEILSSLQDLQRRYGRDAVMMEGHLLGHAVRGGSIMDAAISLPGVEERGGKRFLVFKLDTGIIYNDREVGAASRPARVWNDIVEVSLRKFRALGFQADGVAFLLGYAHKEYADEAELRAHLHDSPGTPEAAAFYLLISDVTELVNSRITSQQLLDRATVLIDGTPTRLVLETPTP